MAMINSRKKTARDFMWEIGGPGVWTPDYREQYDLKDERWISILFQKLLTAETLPTTLILISKPIWRREEEEQLVAELEAAEIMRKEAEGSCCRCHSRAQECIFRKDSRMTNTANKSVLPRAVRSSMKDKHDAGVVDASEIKKKMGRIRCRCEQNAGPREGA
jgi:nucleolar GTP-binding protein